VGPIFMFGPLEKQKFNAFVDSMHGYRRLYERGLLQDCWRTCTWRSRRFGVMEPRCPSIRPGNSTPKTNYVKTCKSIKLPCFGKPEPGKVVIRGRIGRYSRAEI
jgi:hypothetical protein